MNVRTTFVPADSLALLDELRREYLDSLPEPQELLLELWVQHGQGFFIESKGERCGYFVVKDGHTLVEFYLRRPYWVFGEHVVRQIVARLQIERALVKSFDHLLLSSSIAHQTGVRSLGLLVRDYVARPLPALAEMSFEARVAGLTDLDRIIAIEQDVFTDPARLRDVLARGYVVQFERADVLLGFGIIRPIVEGRPDVDLGIAIDTPFRNKGFAIYIFRHMVEHCFARGYNPVAGCAESNPASRRMGERVGMVALYRLLELAFRAPVTREDARDPT
jgi:RimJ/RimL family protein N-acetyltransferase